MIKQKLEYSCANLSEHKRTATVKNNNLKVSLKPALHPLPYTSHALTQTNIHRPLITVVMTEQQQADPRCINRISHNIDKTGHVLGHTQSHRHMKNLLRQVNQTHYLGTATCKHDARSDQVFKTAATQFSLNQCQ